MNFLFLLNAGFLALLALVLLLKRSDKLAFFFALLSVGLAFWNVCIFLTEERLFVEVINAISKVQLLSAMAFTNGLYYFCTSYPQARRNRWHLPNLAVLTILTIAIVFTNSITEATLVNGEIVYLDK